MNPPGNRYMPTFVERIGSYDEFIGMKPDPDGAWVKAADHAAQLGAWRELVAACITPGAIVWPNSWPQDVALIAYRIWQAEQRADAIESAARILLSYRYGVLPTAGWLLDNDGSRLALDGLAQVIAGGAAEANDETR